MKEILQKYPKEILINFILGEGLLFRFLNHPENVERKLLWLQREKETKAAELEMDAALADMDKLKGTENYSAFRAASARFDAANKRSERAYRLYRKAEELKVGQ